MTASYVCFDCGTTTRAPMSVYRMMGPEGNQYRGETFVHRNGHGCHAAMTATEVRDGVPHRSPMTQDERERWSRRPWGGPLAERRVEHRERVNDVTVRPDGSRPDLGEPVHPLFASRDTGARIATRVRVRSGAFAGARGVVVDLTNAPDTIMVRLDIPAGRWDGPDTLTLPFGRSELEVV